MQELLAWISQNVTLVSALTSLFMVCVWAFYAHLFYRDFRTRHHPHLMIHQAPDTQLDSVCLVINMSQNMVNVVCIIAAGSGAQGEWKKEITDYRHFSAGDTDEREIKFLLKQGPISPGNYIHLGSFQKLSGIDNTENFSGVEPPIDSLEIRVVAYFANDSVPMGACRKFFVRRRNEKICLVPDTRHTIQLRSFWRRRKVRKWLDEIFA